MNAQGSRLEKTGLCLLVSCAGLSTDLRWSATYVGAPVPRNKLGDAETMDGVGIGAASRGSEVLRTEAALVSPSQSLALGCPCPSPCRGRVRSLLC